MIRMIRIRRASSQGGGTGVGGETIGDGGEGQSASGRWARTRIIGAAMAIYCHFHRRQPTKFVAEQEPRKWRRCAGGERSGGKGASWHADRMIGRSCASPARLAVTARPVATTPRRALTSADLFLTTTYTAFKAVK